MASLRSQFISRESRGSFGNTIEADSLAEPELEYQIVYIDQVDDVARMQSSISKARNRCISQANEPSSGIKIDLGSKQYFKAMEATVCPWRSYGKTQSQRAPNT